MMPPTTYMPARCSASMARERRVAGAPAALALRVLGRRALQEREVLVEHVLDPEEHVAEPGLPHQRRQRLAVIRRSTRSSPGRCSGCRCSPASMIARHSASNRATFSVMLSSTMKIARAPRARASAMSASTRVEAEGVEVAAAHLDDRAEAAVEGAAARGLDDVDRAAEEGVAVEHARSAVRQRDRAVVEPADRPRRVCERSRPPSWIDRPGDRRQPGSPRSQRAQQIAERQLAFAADDEVDARSPAPRTPPARGSGRSRRRRRVTPGLIARIRRTSAQRGRAAGTSSPTGRRRRDRGRASGARPSAAPASWTRIEIGDRDAMVPVDIAGERRQRAVRHPHRQRRRVLERVRHREEQYSHRKPRVQRAQFSAISFQLSAISNQFSVPFSSQFSASSCPLLTSVCGFTGTQELVSALKTQCVADIRPFRQLIADADG